MATFEYVCSHFMASEINAMAMTAMTSSSALQALNTAFVRKGIVATSEHASRALPEEVHPLLESLKHACALACENARDVASSLQLWKERSLHQTLEALDTATSASVSQTQQQHEKQIEAIETHERAGRELTDMLARHRLETTREVHNQIDVFTASLTAVLSELIRPELAAELEREQAIVQRLVAEKQRLDHAHATLAQTNFELSARLEAIEMAPDGGGDAILCNKLRERVRELTTSKRELLASVGTMEREREQHRWAMQQMQSELERQQRTLLLTKAMHAKETQQLVDLVQSRQTQFAHAMHTSAVAAESRCEQRTERATKDAGCAPRSPGTPHRYAMPPLEVYDPVSGRTIQYANKSPSVSISRVASPSSASVFAASPPQSPKRSLRTSPSLSSSDSRHQQQGEQQQHPRRRTLELSSQAPAIELQPQQPSSSASVQSPTGQVRRLMASQK